MSIRFAGSRFVHERRRRRLAQECGGVSVVPVEEDSCSDPFDGSHAELAPAGAPDHSPVSSIIRPQLWVHWTITVLCLTAWGGMIYLGDLAERTDFGLRDILGLRSGRVTNFFSTLMLLWAGQLSLLIYWYRRKSRNDFAGRYRMWLWIGGMLQFFLVVTATGAHRPFSLYMQRMWPLDIPLYSLLCWLVPVATLALAMYRLLRIELKRHRSGKFLLRVAGLSATVAAATLIVGPLLPVRLRDLLEIGSATLAHLALATALLMHARYVVHISNEVPRRERASRRAMAALRTVAGYLPLPRIRRPKLSLARVGRAVRRVRLPKLGLVKPSLKIPSLPKLSRSLPQLSLPKVVWGRLSSPKGDKPTRQKTSDKRPAQQTSTKNASDASRPTQKPQASSQQVAATTDSPSAGSKAVQTRAVLRSRKPGHQQTAEQERRRVDSAETPRGPRRAPGAPAPTRSLDDILDRYGVEEDVDDETLRSLSKKQRRKLRKKQRELQRTGG
jgi:hypothetical protein